MNSVIQLNFFLSTDKCKGIARLKRRELGKDDDKFGGRHSREKNESAREK